MSKEDGHRIAHALIGDDHEAAEEAASELSKAPPSVSDPTGKELARIIGAGGEPAEAACRVLAESKTKWFGGSGYTKLMKTLMKFQGRGDSLGKAAQLAFQKFIMRGADAKHDEKKIKSRPKGSAKWVWRVLSVAKSIWVIVFYSLVLLFGIPALVGGVDPLIVVPLMLASFALLVGIDGWRRRCPSCALLLAGERLSIVGNEYGNITKWRCVGCQHRWEKQSYSTS